MIIRLLAFSAALVALPAVAQGAKDTKRIDERLANQERRINEGVKSGALTPAEADTLRKAHQKIKDMKQQALADGKVTREERAAIEKELDVQNKAIRKEKHDAEKVAKKKAS